jgi:hypothetical protein
MVSILGSRARFISQVFFLLALINVFGVAHAYASSLSFQSKTEYPVASSPRSVAIADFNGDGIPDIATANFVFSNTVSILMGNGNGAFGLAANIPVTSPFSITTSDFNGDGIPDLATADLNFNHVSVMLGHGDGSFGAPINVAAPSPFFVAVGDFNNDGIKDLVTTDTNDNLVSVFLGNGNGTFGAPINYTVNSPGQIAIKDLNGDGNSDLAVVSAGNISVLLGNGNGTFAAPNYLGTNGAAISITAGDFNGDGVQDLATANSTSNSLSVLLGNGDGTFGTATNIGVDSNARFIASGDVNRDGKTDLFVLMSDPNTGSGNVSVLLGNGDGTFGSATTFGAGYIPSSMIVADLNSDGAPDVAITNQSFITDHFGAVAVLLNNTAPTNLTLHSIGNRIVHAGQNLQFVLSATNPNLDNLTYSATNLPLGATFNQVTNTFSWTPSSNQLGVYSNITFTVNSNGVPVESDSESISVTVENINRPPVLNTINSQIVDENQNLSFVVTASDPDLGNVVTLSASNLPSGSSFNPQTGVFSWTPTFTQSGTYSPVFTATDNGIPIASVSENVSIVVNDVNQPPTLNPISDKSTDINIPLQFTLSGSDPDGNNISFSATGLPAGATLNSTIGAFSWTPTPAQAGTYPVTFTVTDDGTPALSASQTVSIQINAAPVVVPTIPAATINTPYSQPLQVTGGTAPFTWTITKGTLPTGLTLDSTTGIISGTATTLTTKTFTVQVTDSFSLSATSSITLAVKNPLKLSTTALPGGKVGAPYSKTLVATGGVTPYTWSITAGALPDGLSLDAATGIISGTPTTFGTSNVTIQVNDSNSQTVSKSYTVNVNLLHITTGATPNGTASASYSKQLAATGGITPYTWSIIAGSLPSGLSLSAAGLISGTPPTAGTYTFTTQVIDTDGITATKDFTITITATNITTAALPNGKVGNAYSKTMAANSGTAPYSWTITSGSLSSGLSLSADGTISGTPTVAGTVTVTIQATDANGVSDSQGFSLKVNS